MHEARDPLRSPSGPLYSSQTRVDAVTASSLLGLIQGCCLIIPCSPPMHDIRLLKKYKSKFLSTLDSKKQFLLNFLSPQLQELNPVPLALPWKCSSILIMLPNQNCLRSVYFSDGYGNSHGHGKAPGPCPLMPTCLQITRFAHAQKICKCLFACAIKNSPKNGHDLEHALGHC